MSVEAVSTPPSRASGFDLLRVPALGSFLRWRHARAVLQVPLFVLAAALVAAGLLGSPLAPKNPATVLTWVHYRGALVVALLAAGTLFCMACPFMLPRDLARRLLRPRGRWPRALRNKWTALALFVLVLYAYELFDLWGSPAATAALIAGYFAAALLVDGLFRGASFCKFVCPIGQFNFIASTVSPLEVRVRDRQACSGCRTQDCIRGRAATASAPARRGCELALFQPLKVGNMDCTFCLDCVHGCPIDNVGIQARLPGSELFDDPSRSGSGRFSRRPDLAALGIVFTFAALLNAFGMVSPVYAVESWLAAVFGVRAEWPVLGALFIAALVVEPILLLGAAAAWSRRWARMDTGLLPIVVRYAYALVPFGFGVWLAHYAFHLLTGFWTFVPAVQSAFAEGGWPDPRPAAMGARRPRAVVGAADPARVHRPRADRVAGGAGAPRPERAARATAPRLRSLGGAPPAARRDRRVADASAHGDARHAPARMTGSRAALAAAAVVLGGLWPCGAGAHEGPPYAILVDHVAGPYRLSAWADPDLGIGTFYVDLESARRSALPAGTRMELRAQALGGHAPEIMSVAEPKRSPRGRLRFESRVPFDMLGAWRVRFLITGAQGAFEASTQVAVTPPGQGPVLDFVLYLFPFVAVGFLFARAAMRRRPQTRS